MANIVEGYGRRVSAKEFCRYLTLALGSASEMQVHLNVSYELSYITKEEHGRFLSEYKVIARQLHRLIEYWRSIEKPATSD